MLRVISEAHAARRRLGRKFPLAGSFRMLPQSSGPTIRVDVSSVKGKRPKMEDEYVIVDDLRAEAGCPQPRTSLAPFPPRPAPQRLRRDSATSAPGLGSPPPTSAPGLAKICAETATSAPGLVVPRRDAPPEGSRAE